MSNSYGSKFLALIVALLLLGAGVCWGMDNFEYLEEQGLGDNNSFAKSINSHQISESSAPLLDPVLLIPNSSEDNIGMYDPEDGTFLGLFVTGYEEFYTPICAIAGPDSNVYVSDQVTSAVFVFDQDGNYLSTYADASDGLNNIRGIDFRGGHLFVTSGNDYVAEFDAPHHRLADFINDGSEPFDIMFLEDGRALLADIQGNSDNIRLYDADGNLLEVLFSVDFPEQIQVDPERPGDFLNNSFSADLVNDFDLDGTIYQTTPCDGGRGVYRLGNGNLLVTNNNGVYEVEPSSGSIIEQENTGSGRFIELYLPEGEVGIGDNTPGIPTGFSIMQNYPNPFNSSTVISYNLSEPGFVVIDIYNLLGAKVTRLQDGQQPAGQHQVIWDAADMASGTYFYKIQADSRSRVLKMVLLK